MSSSPTFPFMGFDIPEDLALLTGGGRDTWEGISRAHLAAYARYAPIEPHHRVLEIGCGVGRDAIPLADLLRPPGHYTGVDVVPASIDWCQEHVTHRHPHVTFVHLDVRSPMYNPSGRLSVTDVVLPAPDGSVDRALLQSVFTHMFPGDVAHYLRELHRVLRPDGLVFASMFVLSASNLAVARSTGAPLQFPIHRDDDCFIQDSANPEGAVAYTPEAVERLAHAAGLVLDQPVHDGSWPGRTGVPDGQDIVVLRPVPHGPPPGPGASTGGGFGGRLARRLLARSRTAAR